MRQRGSRNKLITIDYDVIGDLVGIAGNTAKQYAHRGEYDPRNLECVLQWVNGRRAINGWPLIGLPEENEPTAVPNGSILSELLQTQNGLLNYDPVTGGFRDYELTGSTAFRR